MSYRIIYGPHRQRKWLPILAVIPILTALILIAAGGGRYEAFARYVGAAIRGH